MAIPAVTTAALLSAPLVVLLFLFGHMATSAPTELCLEGCTCYNDIQNDINLQTINCTSFRPVLTAASSLLSDFTHVDVLNVRDVADGSSEFIIDGLFGVFSNVRYINLINTSISRIDATAFKGLKRLEALDLSKNHIFKFRPETFRETPKLKFLDLSHNPLRLAPTTFLLSKSLEDLTLNSCNLSSVPGGSFRGLPNLKTLDLYDNNIQSFSLRSFPRNLQHLNLAKNSLTNIPTKALTLLKKLTTLDLSENPINCSCSLMGLQDSFSAKAIIFENDVVCKYPHEYEGESWRKVSENEVCFESEETTLIANREDTFENSCENEICDESTGEDRYIYAIQADQAVTDIATQDSVNNVNEYVGSETTVQSTVNNDSGNHNFDQNKIPATEKEDTLDISHLNKSYNLIEDLTTVLENEQDVTPEYVTEDQSDSIKSTTSFLDKSETLNNQIDITESPVVTDFPTKSININFIGENQSSNSLVDKSTNAILSDIQSTLIPQTTKTTHLNLDPSTVAETNPLEMITSAEITTTTEKAIIEESSIVPEERSSPETSLTEDVVGVTINPTPSVTTTVSITTPSVEVNDPSIAHTEETVSIIGTTETSTILPITTTGKDLDNEDFSPTNEISVNTDSSPIIIPETTTAVLDTTRKNFEHEETSIESTTSGVSLEIITSTIPPLTKIEKTNYVPDAKEENEISNPTLTIPTTVSITSTSAPVKQVDVKKDLAVNPTNNTDTIVVLPSTENRKGKILASDENEKPKAETMGSYIVLAGIIIVLLLLILYATTKKRTKSSKKKIPLMHDTENNMTELQDMTTLLPSSPVVNGNKNSKYPNEEPSVTTKLLETDEQPDSNGNGYTYTPEVKNKIDEVVEKNNESNGKSTLPKTNGSSNGAPPLELTKAKVHVMHDSLPRKPSYIRIQKNENS